jgi:hypothetical protein
MRRLSRAASKEWPLFRRKPERRHFMNKTNHCSFRRINEKLKRFFSSRAVQAKLLELLIHFVILTVRIVSRF